MTPTQSIQKSPSCEDLYSTTHSREDESFFITQEEQEKIIKQLLDESTKCDQPPK